MSLIFLIGMPAVGKTYWANKLSAKYGLQLIDLDDYVEQKENDNISAIFAKHGENVFRQKEHEALKEVIDERKKNDAVIACGGGTPCYMGNIDLMKASGKVIYLKASIDTIFDHLREDGPNRPMLQHIDDVPEYLQYLLETRKDVYEQADHIVELDDDSVATFEQIIASCISRQ